MKDFPCWVILLSACLLPGCQDDSGPRGHKSPPPARVVGGTSESNAGKIILTPKAVSRLGIETAVVSLESTERWRLLSGEVVLAPGARTTVQAPFAGTIMPPEKAGIPGPLAEVARGRTVMKVLPLLSPERGVLTVPERLDAAVKAVDMNVRKTDAELVLRAALIRQEGAELALKRARKLASDEVGSERQLEEAKIAGRLAAAEVAAARKRLNIIPDAIGDDEPKAQMGVATLVAPRNGIIEDIFVRSGQLVPSGAALFTVVDPRAVWVRVPVYSGEIASINLKAPATVAELSDPEGQNACLATPIAAPLATPGANSTTVDLFYRFASDGRLYRPKERLLARIPKRGSQKSLVVPWSSILFDSNGNTWVYLEVDANTYRRAAVLLEHRLGDRAILQRGPQVGARVVVTGAAELFGTEFGTGK